MGIGWTEWLIILVVGLLIFGNRLPEVGRSLGRSIVEFKKGLKGVEDEVETASNAPLKPYDRRLGGNEAELRQLQPGNGATAMHETVQVNQSTTS